VVGPALLALSALNAESHRLVYQGPDFPVETPKPWEAEIELTMLEVSSLQNLSADPAQWCRPLADMLFQAFGVERCTYYDEDGT